MSKLAVRLAKAAGTRIDPVAVWVSILAALIAYWTDARYAVMIFALHLGLAPLLGDAKGHLRRWTNDAVFGSLSLLAAHRFDGVKFGQVLTDTLLPFFAAILLIALLKPSLTLPYGRARLDHRWRQWWKTLLLSAGIGAGAYAVLANFSYVLYSGILVIVTAAHMLTERRRVMFAGAGLFVYYSAFLYFQAFYLLEPRGELPSMAANLVPVIGIPASIVFFYYGRITASPASREEAPALAGEDAGISLAN